MPCTPFKHLGPSGMVGGIVCSKRGQNLRTRCAYCGDFSSRLCDYPVTRKTGEATIDRPIGRKQGTCDTPLCDRCTTRIAGDGDLCREHAPMFKTMGEAQKADVS